MFTKNLKDQFSADLLKAVEEVIEEGKGCKNCGCKKCECEDDEDEKDEMKEASEPYHYFVSYNAMSGHENHNKLLHDKKKPFKSEGDAIKHIMKIADGHPHRRQLGRIHKVDAKTGNIVKVVNHDTVNKGYGYSPKSGDAQHVRDLKESLEEAKQHIEEGITSMSDARLKYHATKKFPHGSYTSKQIEDEHQRRRKAVPNYHAVKASLGEEAEQIDEIGNTPAGKRALGRYIKDRRGTILGTGMGMERQNHDRSTTDKQRKDLGRKASNAFIGVGRAVDRLTKEEVEHIDELSKKTLGSYIMKASGAEAPKNPMDRKSNPLTKIHAYQSDSETGHFGSRFNQKGYDKAERLRNNREKGIARAVGKLTKEEQEFIDSLNADNLEEGRGRPPKEGSAAWHAKQKQENDDMIALGAQLRKAKSMNKKVRFMNGKEHEIHPNHIDRFEDHMAARKTSQDKAAFQKQAHKSHEDFVKAVTAPVPKAHKDTGEIVKYRH